LITDDHLPITAAARAVGISASALSGKDAMLTRYRRDGIAGLTRCRIGAPVVELTRQIERLGWFVPAAQFFYLSARRRHGALVGAVRRAVALPELPCGWHQETVARFLARLNLEAPPQCPASLREELLSRERAGKAIVPPRIERLIQVSPANIERYCTEAPIGELARINFTAIVTRLAELRPGGNCRLTLELL
jgi:hypothetical protein